MRTIVSPFTVYRPTTCFLDSMASGDHHAKGAAEFVSMTSPDLDVVQSACTKLRAMGALVPVGQLAVEYEALLEMTSGDDWHRSKHLKKQKTADVSWHPTKDGDVFMDGNGRFVVVLDGQLQPFRRTNRPSSAGNVSD